MAFLQACIDDSNSEVGEQRLYMAGFLMSTEKWAAFSEAWDEELRAEPSIQYFKMVEANGLRGQFAGWDARNRDEKLERLWDIIQVFEPISFEVSESRKSYLEVSQHAPYFLNIYFFLASGVAVSWASILRNHGMTTPIEFIFDQQSGLSADLLILWELILQNLPIRTRRLLRTPPMFRDDREFLPLQAADFLVWHLRRAHEAGKDTAYSKSVKASGRHVDLNIKRTGPLSEFRDGLRNVPSLFTDYGTKPDWRKLKAEVAARRRQRNQDDE